MTASSFKPKQVAVVALSFLTIAASAFWIVRYQRTTTSATLAPHRELGKVMAERMTKLLDGKDKKRIVLVTLDSSEPAIRAQMESFDAELKKDRGIEIVETVRLDPKENPKYRPGDGLSARRYARLVRNHQRAEGMVSFVGVPDPTDEELKTLTNRPPRLVAFTRDLEKLPLLFKDRRLRVAIVPRYEFPAPGPENPTTQKEWFERNFQIVTSNTLAKIIQ